ncbi:hypothetical protein GCM10025787_20400 [Saccharopolyspora rosea]
MPAERPPGDGEHLRPDGDCAAMPITVPSHFRRTTTTPADAANRVKDVGSTRKSVVDAPTTRFGRHLPAATRERSTVVEQQDEQSDVDAAREFVHLVEQRDSSRGRVSPCGAPAGLIRCRERLLVVG